MYKNTLLLSALLVLFLTNTYFQCGKDCESETIYLKAGNYAWRHLNEKSTPVKELQAGEDGWKDGYGFRIYASSELVKATDTIGAMCPLFTLSPRIQSVSLRSLTGMGDLFPAGSDVTPLFGFVNGAGLSDISGAGPYFSNILAVQGTSHCDFVLANALKDAGWQQLEIKLNLDDATSVTMVTDSIYLK